MPFLQLNEIGMKNMTLSDNIAKLLIHLFNLLIHLFNYVKKSIRDLKM